MVRRRGMDWTIKNPGGEPGLGRWKVISYTGKG